ncbi:cytochrome c oxidase subunit II [bacterium]|nr:MAG: cytochrome c oxidase subunit II [bacterium]
MFSSFPFSPPSASNFASEYDTLFWVITALTVVFTVIVAGLVLLFAIRYRRGTTADRSRPVYENLWFEVSSMTVPTILGLMIFVWGTRLFVNMRTPPPDATELFVIGKQWMWHIQHPDGTRENNTLHVPLGKPVKLTMISQDVIHAFYIPAMRVQYMVVPGRYTQMWFTPTQKGEFHLFCNMYCGTQHSEMGGRVVVMEPRAYAEWLAKNGETTPPLSVAQAGERLFNKVGCANCHVGQDNLRGPTLNGIYNTARRMEDGSTMRADETYLRESILRPSNHITQGYENSMLPYEGQLTEDQVVQLIAYIRGAGSNPISPSSDYSLNTSDVSSQIGGRQGNATNALQYNSQRSDSTPTIRNNTPAVGALAATPQTERR